MDFCQNCGFLLPVGFLGDKPVCAPCKTSCSLSKGDLKKKDCDCDYCNTRSRSRSRSSNISGSKVQQTDFHQTVGVEHWGPEEEWSVPEPVGLCDRQSPESLVFNDKRSEWESRYQAHRDCETFTMATDQKWNLSMCSYQEQNQRWPQSGKHILAHYDEDTVVVYQAFNPSIADYAVEHQRFGGPHYKPGRMSWIKTNFMWMMYRCGWARKQDQERVLAIRITKAGFEEILSLASTVKDDRSSDESCVRLQWDPDHNPTGDKQTRRAIQLGMKGKILSDFGSKFIVNIQDITPFVTEQRANCPVEKQRQLLSPLEKVYTPSRGSICRKIELDLLPQ